MPQVVVRDTLISYKDVGSGPVLLSLHGWMHDASSYDQLAEQIKSSYRIIAPDLPNFGSSEATESIITIDDYGQFLGAFIEKLKLTDFMLAGHSMGGQIAIHAVSRGIIRPQKLVLIASAGIRNHNKPAKYLMRTASKVFRKVTPKSMKKSFYKKIGSDYSSELSSIHKKIIQSTLGMDVQADAKDLKLPVLLVYGSADIQTPPWMGKKFAAEIPGSRLEVLEGADHWLHQKSALQVAGIIESFLNDR